MVTQVRKWGNSMAVRLPRTLVEAADLKAGSSVDLAARNGCIVLTPVRPARHRLADLVRKITKRNRHGALLEDAPRGREVW